MRTLFIATQALPCLFFLPLSSIEPWLGPTVLLVYFAVAYRYWFIQKSRIHRTQSHWRAGAKPGTLDARLLEAIMPLLNALDAPIETRFGLSLDVSPFVMAFNQGSSEKYVLVIPKGFSRTYGPETPEAAAVVAHELGHIANGDALFLDYARLWGRVLMRWAIPLCAIALLASFQYGTSVGWHCGCLVAMLLLAWRLRVLVVHAEFEADRYAVASGHGYGLIEALLRTQNLERGVSTFWHPSTKMRLEEARIAMSETETSKPGLELQDQGVAARTRVPAVERAAESLAEEGTADDLAGSHVREGQDVSGLQNQQADHQHHLRH